MDLSRTAAILVLAALAACSRADLPPPNRAERPAVRIQLAAVRVVVIPEVRADVVASAPGAELDIARDGMALNISDGSKPGANCKPAVDPAALPQVTVRTPLTVDIHSVGAVVGDVGPAAELKLASGGCGRWRAAAASGPAELVQAGAGSLELGEARMGLTAKVSGKGSVKVGQAQGLLSADVEGPGQLEIGEGVNQRAFLHLNGPGRIEHKGRIGTLRAELEGSGRIVVATVTGQVQRRLRGTGEVSWGRPQGRSYCGGVSCQRRRDARGER